MTQWTEIQWCSEPLPKSQLSSLRHMTLTIMNTSYWEREACLMQRWPSLLLETGSTNEIPSLREPDNLIIWTLLFSNIIFHYFNHLSCQCVPPDSGLIFITATLLQQTPHTFRYLYMFPTYRECPSHMAFIYLIILSIIPCKICFLFVHDTIIYEDQKSLLKTFLNKFYSNQWVF